MLDITEIQTVVDGFSANKAARRGLFNAVLYYIMSREAKPVFKANQEQIFIWATSDHSMQKFLRGLKLESWKKGRAAQLTRDNNNEFLDAVENSSEFPDWNDYRNLVKKLTLAFQNAEKEKTQQIEMDIEAISNVLAQANVPHVHVTAFDDRQIQEQLRDELVNVAKNAGFDDTKAFVIDISKTSANVYAVALYLKPYYGVSETSYKLVVRDQHGTLAEYDPETVTRLGLRSKLGQFRRSKFAAVVRDLFNRSEANRPKR